MNRIYETPTTKSYAITKVIGWESQQLNDWVCKHGVGPTYFGRRCGQIINADTTWTYNNKITPAKQANFAMSVGDSGGPVAYNAGIFGIVATVQGHYQSHGTLSVT